MSKQFFKTDSEGGVSFIDHPSGTSVPVFSKKMGDHLIEDYVLPEDKKAAEAEFSAMNLPAETSEEFKEAEVGCFDQLNEDRESQEAGATELRKTYLGIADGASENKKRLN